MSKILYAENVTKDDAKKAKNYLRARSLLSKIEGEGVNRRIVLLVPAKAGEDRAKAVLAAALGYKVRYNIMSGEE